MAASLHSTEPDIATAAAAAAAVDPVVPSRSDPPPPPPPARWHGGDEARVRLMCSFGGRIIPRPGDHKLRYVGGDTRIVAFPRGASYASLMGKLYKLPGCPAEATLKYQLPNEDLDALISVTSDEDVENLMEEYDRLGISAAKGPRFRLFLFPPPPSSSSLDSPAAGALTSSWFVDALNGGGGGSTRGAPGGLAPMLERGRSEASSILSEVPDYLFGLDSTSDETAPLKPPAKLPDDTGSPVPSATSPHFASAPAPELPPEETQAQTQTPPSAAALDPSAPAPAAINPQALWHYVPEPLPLYYVPGPITGANLPLRPFTIPLPVQYIQQAHAGAQVPLGIIRGYAPSIGRPALASGTYEYQLPPASGEAAGGGIGRSPAMVPAYPVQVAGETPAVSLGMNRTSQGQ